MEKIISKKNIVILKPNLSLDEVKSLTEKKKTGLFGSKFTRPKSKNVEISTINLFFEPIWKFEGEYNIDFYRKNLHQISVDPHVKEIVIGTGVFPVLTESGTWKKFKDSIAIRDKKNKIDLSVEEHLEINRESEIYLNSQGQEINPDLKIQSKNIENFPEQFIHSNQSQMRSTELSDEEIVNIFLTLIKNDIGECLRIVSERLVLNIFEQIFLPVYEIRLVDSKNVIKILRIDGMSSKIL